MKALVVKEGRATLDNLAVPELRGTQQVIVDVLVAGICRTDIAVANGDIPIPASYAFGHECTGRVVDIGADVSELHQGQRVAINPVVGCSVCAFCCSGAEHLCADTQLLGVDRPGVFCEKASVLASRCYPVADHVSDYMAAYAEPVAAMLSVLDVGLEKGMKVGIIGDDRISALCRYILHSQSIETLDGVIDEVDALVVCSAIEHIPLEVIRPGGMVIIKTRLASLPTFNMAELVVRRIKIVGANYAPFQQAINFIERHSVELTQFVGCSFELAEYERAFNQPNIRKSFFKICAV